MQGCSVISGARLFLVSLSFLFCTLPLRAADVTLAWDPNTEANLAGYKIYHGTAPGTYLAPIVIGKQTIYTVSGLQPGTHYFSVTAFDTFGNESGFSNEVFTTIGQGDGTPPIISNVAASAVTSSGAAISWNTDTASDSQVEYGTALGYGHSTILNTGMFTSHAQTLTGLAAGTLYHYRVKSANAAGSLAISGDFTFTTAPQADVTSPGIAITSPTSAPTYSAVSASLSISGTASDNVGVALVTWSNDRGGGGTAAGTASWSVTGITLQSGANVITVTARDAAGNTGAAVLTVTYSPADTAAPVITNVGVLTITSSTAVITWATDEASDSQAEYGTSAAYGSSTAINTGLVTAHSQSLAGLAPSTLYHFRVRSKDAAGNTAVSGDLTFVTAAGSDGVAPTVNISVPTSSAAYSTSAAVIDIGGSASDNAGVTLVTWSSSRGGSGTASGTSSWSVGGIPLQSGTNIITVTARDAAGNAGSATLTVTCTLPDTAAPVISGVTCSGISSSSAVIVWNTDEDADSQVEYGTTTEYGSSTLCDTGLTKLHNRPLAGLATGTRYHFRVISRDAAGNRAVSGDYGFSTVAPEDTTPPAISEVRVSNLTKSSATVTWNTDEDSDSMVDYGTTPAYGRSTARDASLTRSHSQSLGGLQEGTHYHFRVVSKDAAGNVSTSEDGSFITSGMSDGGAILVVPRFESGHAAASLSEDNYLGIALVNLDSLPATVTFTAIDSGGSAVTGQDISNPAARVLGPGEQLPSIDTQLFGGGLALTQSAGWIKLQSPTQKVSGFFLTFNGDMTALDGANMDAESLTSCVLPEIEDRGYTKLDLANPNSEPVSARIDLVKADGTVRGTATGNIASNGALVVNLADLFDGLKPAITDYIRVQAAKGIQAFALLRNSPADVEVLSAQDAAGGSSVLYSPQYAVGGPWRSTISVINLDSRAGKVSFKFIAEDLGQIGSARELVVEPNGKIFIDDQQFFQVFNLTGVTQGYVEIAGDGIRLAGSVVIGDREGKTFAAALPLISRLRTSMLFSHVASNDLYFTGLALVNTNNTEAAARIELYAASGALVSSTTQSLPARQRKSRLLTEYFPGIIGQDWSSGYIRVTTDKPVAAFSLFGTNNLSVLSAIPPQNVP